jgi:hypothetical protein
MLVRRKLLNQLAHVVASVSWGQTPVLNLAGINCYRKTETRTLNTAVVTKEVGSVGISEP